MLPDVAGAWPDECRRRSLPHFEELGFTRRRLADVQLVMVPNSSHAPASLAALSKAGGRHGEGSGFRLSPLDGAAAGGEAVRPN